MSEVLFPPDSPCPCGAPLTAGECCLFQEPPIWRDERRIVSSNINASLRSVGHPLVAPRVSVRGMRFEMVFNVPGQLDERIMELGDAAMRTGEHLLQESAGEAWVEAVAEPTQSLEGALYRVRYHQRQFLFRLRKVTVQQAFYFSAGGNTASRVNDRPLNAELEAFVVSVGATVERLCALMCAYFDRSPKGHGSVKGILKLLRHPEILDAARRRQVKRRFEREEKWLAELREFRNESAHKGGFQRLEGVGNEGMLLIDAEINGRPAGDYVIRVWRDLTKFVDGCLSDLRARTP